MGYERNTGRPYSDYGARMREEPRNDHRDRSYRDRDSRDRDYRARSDYAQPRDYDDDRGFIDRAGDEVRSWFGDEDAERRRRWDERLHDREEERRYADPDVYDSGRYTGSHPGNPRGMRSGSYDSPGSTYGAGRGAGASSTWGLGAGPSHDGWGQDPNYTAWRRRQLAELDRDYDEYRRENESRFHADFGNWRTTRQTQRSSLGKVQEHQEVVGSDGSHIGKVDHVRGDRILLTKTDKDAGGHHHSIPCSWIVDVSDKVTLNRTAAQAQDAWKDEERRDGPHYLNRAFPGTY